MTINSAIKIAELMRYSDAPAMLAPPCGGRLLARVSIAMAALERAYALGLLPAKKSDQTLSLCNFFSNAMIFMFFYGDPLN